MLDKYTIVERNQVRRIFNWLQCFTPAALEREFAGLAYMWLSDGAMLLGARSILAPLSSPSWPPWQDADQKA